MEHWDAALLVCSPPSVGEGMYGTWSVSLLIGTVGAASRYV
jgi:hypothetical protein